MARDVVEWFRTRNLNQDWTIAGSYFRCEKCGHRGARLGWEPLFPPPPPPPPPLESIDRLKQRKHRERG